MTDFDKARSFFDTYQQHGGIDNLKEALDILDDIIESQSVGLQKAINLKTTISKFIDNQIKTIRAKYNIGEFNKNMGTDTSEVAIRKFVNELFSSATDEDAKKLIELLMTSVEYWKTKK